jgi:hypothetical protein
MKERAAASKKPTLTLQSYPPVVVKVERWELSRGFWPVQVRRAGPVSQKSAEALDTRAELAKLSGLSHDTIHKAKVKKIPP